MSKNNVQSQTETKNNEPPKQITLQEENYESFRVEDGKLILELSDKAAEFLYAEGFTRDE